jgi:hypothetical protein
MKLLGERVGDDAGKGGSTPNLTLAYRDTRAMINFSA